ncbi:MAG: methyltransferase domain-containing protein [Hyphomicrobiales bacterium]|nr:methyltransferase domain-containing protein [Hyphomicrobiales bacterium]MDE2113473.1 class I SAM-dependent methyltransferase [Hyphomicrobiales bacterium]
MTSLESHWQNVYAARAPDQVTWFEPVPEVSLAMIKSSGAPANARIIDIGGGASNLVDHLLGLGYPRPTVLDVSAAALAKSEDRLGVRASEVDWIVADMLTFASTQTYDIWHDRAALHFLTAESDQQAYVRVLKSALKLGGSAILGTFAPDGPERCSGLPVVRRSAPDMASLLGSDFALQESQRHLHPTPAGNSQQFQFARLRRIA